MLLKKSRRPELDPSGVVCLYGGMGLSRARSNLLHAVVVTLPRIVESSKKRKEFWAGVTEQSFKASCLDSANACLDLQKKGNYHFKLCMPFVGLAPVRRLHPSMAVLYHVNGKLQRAYLKPLRCFIVCFVGWTHHWYGSSCPTLSLGYIDRCLEGRTLHRADVTQVHASGTLRSEDGEGNENVKRAVG